MEAVGKEFLILYSVPGSKKFSLDMIENKYQNEKIGGLNEDRPVGQNRNARGEGLAA